MKPFSMKPIPVGHLEGTFNSEHKTGEYAGIYPTCYLSRMYQGEVITEPYRFTPHELAKARERAAKNAEDVPPLRKKGFAGWIKRLFLVLLFVVPLVGTAQVRSFPGTTIFPDFVGRQRYVPTQWQGSFWMDSLNNVIFLDSTNNKRVFVPNRIMPGSNLPYWFTDSAGNDKIGYSTAFGGMYRYLRFRMPLSTSLATYYDANGAPYSAAIYMYGNAYTITGRGIPNPTMAPSFFDSTRQANRQDLAYKTKLLRDVNGELIFKDTLGNRIYPTAYAGNLFLNVNSTIRANPSQSEYFFVDTMGPRFWRDSMIAKPRRFLDRYGNQLHADAAGRLVVRNAAGQVQFVDTFTKPITTARLFTDSAGRIMADTTRLATAKSLVDTNVSLVARIAAVQAAMPWAGGWYGIGTSSFQVFASEVRINSGGGTIRLPNDGSFWSRGRGYYVLEGAGSGTTFYFAPGIGASEVMRMAYDASGNYGFSAYTHTLSAYNGASFVLSGTGAALNSNGDINFNSSYGGTLRIQSSGTSLVSASGATGQVSINGDRTDNSDTKLFVNDGDVELTKSGSGIIIKDAATGTRYKIRVYNGSVGVVAVP